MFSERYELHKRCKICCREVPEYVDYCEGNFDCTISIYPVPEEEWFGIEPTFKSEEWGL